MPKQNKTFASITAYFSQLTISTILLWPLCHIPDCYSMSHDLGAVTIFRFSELGLGFRLRLGIGLGLGLGLRLGFWLGL